MVADFFTIAGFNVTFVGAYTPLDAFLSAVERIKPEFVAISVTNFYNLVASRRFVKDVKAAHLNVKVIVGGRAFGQNPEKAREFGADMLLQTYEEIEKLARGA